MLPESSVEVAARDSAVITGIEELGGTTAGAVGAGLLESDEVALNSILSSPIAGVDT